MALDYINAAFKRLDLLEEQMFDTSLNGINQLSDFMDNDNTDEIIRVIDPEADTEEELQNSYVGKVIINCNVCHSHIFEDKEDITIEEEGAVNIEMSCPYCGEQEGFTIVGEIAPYSVATEAEEAAAEEDEPVETVEVEADEKMEEPAEEDTNESFSMSRASRRLMQEDFKEVSITTDDQHMEMTADESGKVTITTEPISCEECTEDAETIVPVSTETEEEILSNNEVDTEQSVENTEESVEDILPADDSLEFEFDEVDDDGLNDLGESYLRKVYENVESFRTTDVASNDQTLIVEGIITFASGTQKKTGFIFEANDVNDRGQLRFNGSNKHLCESANAYTLVGKIDNKKLFLESLKYNYTVNNTPVRGIVRRK